MPNQNSRSQRREDVVWCVVGGNRGLLVPRICYFLQESQFIGFVGFLGPYKDLNLAHAIVVHRPPYPHSSIPVFF
jgi:hypothetical protein